MDIVARPDWLFDRERPWRTLAEFATGPGSALAVVYGRRRQGKTALLTALAGATGGFYWQARQQSARQNLTSFALAWSQWSRASGTLRIDGWEEAFALLFGDRDRPTFVAIDEFGYLLDNSPEVASIIQAHLTPASEHTGSTRLVLCGSVYSQMRQLVAADAPLRGRASVELVIGPFDYRTSASYWGLDGNVQAAFLHHALVGGTPAYRRLAGAVPERGSVARWIEAHLLDPSSPLHREGRIVVEEDPTLGDRSLYWGLLGAIAEGSRRRRDLAAVVGRPESALTFPLRVLSDGAWIELRGDPLHRNRSTLLLTEPIVRTHRVLVEPDELRLARGHAQAVWEDAQPRVAQLILAPHLEWMAAEWVLAHADAETIGGRPQTVGPSVLSAGGRRYQLDVVAAEAGVVHLVGEVKATTDPMGADQLDRLDEVIRLLGPRARAGCRRLLVSRSGFTAELRRAVRRRPDVVLADLDRLYHGT